MTDPAITLYRLQACPYCERVARALDRLDIPYRSRYVEPIHSERNVVKRVSGKRSVPAIVDEETGVTMAESANIVDYLERTYGGSEVAATDGGAVGGRDVENDGVAAGNDGVDATNDGVDATREERGADAETGRNA